MRRNAAAVRTIVSTGHPNRCLNASSRRLSSRRADVSWLANTALPVQVLRANQAVKWLREGHRIADVAADLGYADQAHLTHSLRRIMGRTPGQILGQAGL
jgi:AraC-like DNA-binding protein